MRKLIYTVIIGRYDRLIEPPPIPGWDFVCLTDNPSLSWRAQFRVSRWRLELLSVDHTATSAVASRRPKLLPHYYFPNHDYSIYIDGNVCLTGDPASALVPLGWPMFAASEHPKRRDIYAEINVCAERRLCNLALLEAQAATYRAMGVPELRVSANYVLCRRHNEPAVVSLDEMWWQEYRARAPRDQICLPYCEWQLGTVKVDHLARSEVGKFMRWGGHHQRPWSLRERVESKLRSLASRIVTHQV
jgi:hypothetical protein